MSALSPSQQPTVLFSIYQNQTLGLWDDWPSDPAYYIEDCRILNEVCIAISPTLCHLIFLMWRACHSNLVMIDSSQNGKSLKFITPPIWKTLVLCRTAPFDEHNMKQCIEFAYILDFAYLFTYLNKVPFLNYEILSQHYF